MPMLFVTGTDTGVGKTVITAGIARVLRDEGLSVGVMKPVVSGLVQKGEDQISEDVEFLVAASGVTDPVECIAPIRLPLPAAPQLAAEVIGTQVSIQAILDAARALEDRYALLLVEGAGGWNVPITRGFLMRDLAAALEAPVLVVGRAGLGTINHTVLTVEAIERAGQHALGIVLNGADPAGEDAVERENPRLIREQTDVPVLGVLPQLVGVSVEKVRMDGLTQSIRERLQLDPIRALAQATV